MNILNIILMSPPQGPAGQQQGGSFLIPMLLILVVMYVFMFLPQMRKSKKQKAFISEMKKGDNIVTTGGIHGKIVFINETHAIIEIEQGKMKIERNGISMELSKALETAKDKGTDKGADKAEAKITEA